MAKQKSDLNAMQKAYLARRNAERGTMPDDDAFRTAYPELWSLCTTWWLDPTHRVEAASIIVQVMSGDWVARVNLPSLASSKTVCVPTFADALTRLEEAVRGNAVPWVPNLRRTVKIGNRKQNENGLDFDQHKE